MVADIGLFGLMRDAGVWELTAERRYVPARHRLMDGKELEQSSSRDTALPQQENLNGTKAGFRWCGTSRHDGFSLLDDDSLYTTIA